jgi:hypothetical protein
MVDLMHKFIFMHGLKPRVSRLSNNVLYIGFARLTSRPTLKTFRCKHCDPANFKYSLHIFKFLPDRMPGDVAVNHQGLKALPSLALLAYVILPALLLKLTLCSKFLQIS